MKEIKMYKGFKIEIQNDLDPINPCENFYSMAPLMYESQRNTVDYSNGEIASFLLDYLTDGQVIRHQKKLVTLLGIYDVPTNRSEKINEIRDCLYDFINDGIKEKIAFCELFGIKYFSKESKGYSQSDYADIFICWTPEFGKKTDVTYKKVTSDTFESTFDLFESWIWGDVYQYTVTKDNNNETFEIIGGYYGSDHEKSGLLDDARYVIDMELKN